MTAENLNDTEFLANLDNEYETDSTQEIQIITRSKTDSPLTRAESLLMYGIFSGIGLGVVITGLVVVIKSNFLSNQAFINNFIIELLLLGLFIMGSSVIALLVAGLATKLWTAYRETSVDLFPYLAFIMVVSALGIVYLFMFPDFSLLQDPFNLTNIHTILAQGFSLLWFISLVISALVVIGIILISLSSLSGSRQLL